MINTNRKLVNPERMKNNKIPKIIHQIWIGEEIPDILKLYTEAWKRMRGWDYKLWGNNDLQEQNFPMTWKLIKKMLSRKKPVYAMITDLMRLEILYRHGGVYLDTTFEKVKNLNTLLDKSGYKFVMANEIPDPGLKLPYISNSFIASVSHYIVLKRLLNPSKLSRINIGKKANKETGPYYVRSAIKKINEVTMVPTSLIYPYDILDWEEGHTSACVRLRWKKGYKRYTYFDKVYYVKYPCPDYPHAYMIKQWDIGGTWLLFSTHESWAFWSKSILKSSGKVKLN